ncbi:MAG: response regulator [Candidatus Moraniibacteriota bacterium]
MLKNKNIILIAEDEEDLMEIYTISFAREEVEILQARNGMQALEILEKNSQKIDLLILDIMMPKLNGFEVLEKIRQNEQFRDLSIIMSTNLDDEDDKKQAFQLGAKAYFVKALRTPSELVAQVRMLLMQN